MNFKLNPIIFATAVSLAASSLAVENDIVSMSITDNSISWAPQIEYASIRLSISGPDGDSSKTFAAEEDITLDTSAMADGTYQYELAATPTSAGGSAGSTSGAFTIANGAVADPELPENTDKVFFHTTDGSIGGSLCIGFDCISVEPFGFDTLRLKENNLRLHFDDTSNTAAFPFNDWRITANDSANGGASHLSIEDATAGRSVFRVFAGARDNALVVDAQGDLGLGTTTPVLDIDIKTGNSPGIRLQQDATSGFTPQSWDIVGNETNFFIRDVTSGSRLPFRIRPGAPTSSIDVAASGNVGIGTSSPDSTLDIEAATPELRLTSTAAGQQWEMRMNNAGNLNFQVQGSGNNVLQLGPGANNNLLRVGTVAANQVDITGNLVITGTCSAGGSPGCDAVFQANYPLESIEEHAASMWNNSYLPGVGPTPDNRQIAINVFEKTTGILNELEKAHIYIEQLHHTVKGLKSENLALHTANQQFEQQFIALQAGFEQRLQRLEQRLAN